jgi:hypothetical protein
MTVIYFLFYKGKKIFSQLQGRSPKEPIIKEKRWKFLLGRKKRASKSPPKPEHMFSNSPPHHLSSLA